MSETVDLLPDAEAAASIWLRAQGIASGRVYSSIPSNATYPLVKIARVGGVPVTRMRLDAADLQFDVYGNTKSEARLLAAQVRQSLFLMQDQTIDIPSGDAFVTKVRDSTGMFWLPDSSNVVKDRYVFSMLVHLHAA